MWPHYEEISSCFIFFPPMSARNHCLGGVSGHPVGPGDLPQRLWFLRPTDVSQPGSTVGRMCQQPEGGGDQSGALRPPSLGRGGRLPTICTSCPCLAWGGSQRHTIRTVLLFLVAEVLPGGWVLLDAIHHARASGAEDQGLLPFRDPLPLTAAPAMSSH